jgi:hypothetical protein
MPNEDATKPPLHSKPYNTSVTLLVILVPLAIAIVFIYLA